MGVQMKVKNGKWWNMASGIELIGMILFVIIIIPAVVTFLKAEVADMQYEEAQQHEQRTLIEDLSRQVEELKLEVSK